MALISSTTHQWPQSSSDQKSLNNMVPSLMEKQSQDQQQQQQQPLKCPRCDSSNTKFCYYNNYSLSQPRHFCKACKRYWTRGGTLRNVPVGGGYRKNKRVITKKPSISQPSQNIDPPSSSSQIINPLFNYGLQVNSHDHDHQFGLGFSSSYNFGSNPTKQIQIQDVGNNNYSSISIPSLLSSYSNSIFPSMSAPFIDHHQQKLAKSYQTTPNSFHFQQDHQIGDYNNEAGDHQDIKKVVDQCQSKMEWDNMNLQIEQIGSSPYNWNANCYDPTNMGPGPTQCFL
ncbi:hypothetical protein ACFE04_003319 [Oxalis oulophora]